MLSTYLTHHFNKGEAHLKAASIYNNHRLLDDQHRDHGNKIDLIIDLIDVPFEISIIEISGSPSESDHTHYVGDRNKIAKMLKMMLNCIINRYMGSLEQLRKVKLYAGLRFPVQTVFSKPKLVWAIWASQHFL